MGVPSGDSTTPLIKIRFYQQRDLEPHIYCKEKLKQLNSKLVDIVTVANVDDEDCIGKSLLQI